MAFGERNQAFGSVELFQADGLEMLYAFPYALFEGVTSVTLDVSLPRNALVDAFRVQVQARRVDVTQLQQVAQLRAYASASGNELVIDFGTPRTINGILLPAGVNVLAVYGWLGSQFSPQAAFAATDSSGDGSPVFAELRSERLRVLLTRSLKSSELDAVRVRLPEPPSGLTIRIDDAATPAWSHPEPVQPRATVAQPDAAGWDAQSRRSVDLTAALAALTGDPLASDDAVTLRLTLATQVPCALALAETARTLRRVRRVRFGSGTTTADLAFASEGVVDLPLALPPPAAGLTRHVSELRWTAVADLPALRTLPPVGPDAAPLADGTVLADLQVTPERAAIVRLPGDSGLALLHGVRLPLAAGGDGAEVRAVLWAPGAPGGLPSEPLPQGASAPLTLGADAADERWVSLDFGKPLAVDAAAMPWLAIVVARGSVTWALAAAAAGGLGQQVVRRGPPNGPWKALPAALQSATGVFDARGRVRLGGTAPKDAPLAPMTLALVGWPAAADLLPAPKGAPGSLRPAPAVAVQQPLLRIVSRVAGSLALRDIDVVSDI